MFRNKYGKLTLLLDQYGKYSLIQMFKTKEFAVVKDLNTDTGEWEKAIYFSNIIQATDCFKEKIQAEYSIKTVI